MLRKGIFILLLAITSQVYSYQEKNCSTFVFADALLWKLREAGAEDWAQQLSADPNNRTANVLDVPFNWSPGFRLGVGKNLGYDDWDLVFYYTWYKTNRFRQASMPSGSITSSYLGNFFANNTNGRSITGPQYRNASIRWKLLFNTFDLELGRRFTINEFLDLRPFIGIKAGVINQKIYTTWQSPTNFSNFTHASENLTNDFWGVGPAIGLDTAWAIYKCCNGSFSVIGNFSTALLPGRWSFSDNYQNNAPTNIALKVQNFTSNSSMVRALLGLEWTRHCRITDLAFRCGYEAQIWFDQLQNYSFNGGRLGNQMSLQGAILGMYVNL